MRMPRSVRVGHRTYEIVSWNQQAAEAEGARGDCRAEPPVIRVSKGLKPFDRAEVLLHEVFHSCWRHLPSDGVSEEAAVTVLAENFAAVIGDNPGLIAWLSENLRRTV
jgi:hypothetical protein